jgi:sortase A
VKPRHARALAATLALAGVALLAWVAVVLLWGEPITALRAGQAQRALARQLEEKAPSWPAAQRRPLRRSPATRMSPAARTSEGGRQRTAAGYRASLRAGDAIGRIIIARIGLQAVIVEGTSTAELRRGPGHYRMTALPGAGSVVAIAGHRTTYLQPFRHIDELQPGDNIDLLMPYGSFRYQVYATQIVDPHDWSILRPRPFEELVLTACQPLYSASHRIVVYARLRTATPF